MANYLYYQVGDFITTNKMLALERANSNIDQVHFYVADDDYAQHDWTVEPSEDINTLIDQRVQEIRDQHGYVCLWYSGGYDSQTILDSFVRQKIRLDEVIIYTKKWLSTDHVHHLECVAAYSYAMRIKNTTQPWLHINVVNYDQNAPFKFYRDHKDDWIYQDHGSFASVTKSNRSLNSQLVDDYKRIVNTTNRLDINGVDKPRLNLVNGNWYMQMPDRLLQAYFDSPYDLFYISPCAVKINIKQTWLAIKWFETFKECSHEFVHNIQGNKCSDMYYREWNLGFGRNDVYNTISKYGLVKSTLGPDPYSEESLLLAEILKTHEPDLLTIWQSGLDHMKTTQAKNWEENQGLRTILSKPIFVKKFTNHYE